MSVLLICDVDRRLGFYLRREPEKHSIECHLSISQYRAAHPASRSAKVKSLYTMSEYLHRWLLCDGLVPPKRKRFRREPRDAPRYPGDG